MQTTTQVTAETITDDQIRELRIWALQHAAGTDVPYACLRALPEGRRHRRAREVARCVVAAAWNARHADPRISDESRAGVVDDVNALRNAREVGRPSAVREADVTGRASKAGRKPATAPPGRLTLQQVADQAGLTRARVQQLVKASLLPARRELDGSWTIAEADAARVRRHEAPPAEPRRAVMVRVPIERYRRWERAADGRPVSTWLAELADASCRDR